MKAIELPGDIDEKHRLHAEVPPEVPAGPVRLIVLLPDDDEVAAWPQGVSKEWSEDLLGIFPAEPNCLLFDKLMHPGKRYWSQEMCTTE